MPDDSTPFLQSPKELDPQPEDLYCFKDAARPCAAECMAYMTYVPEGDDYKGQQWAHCRLLVDSHRTAKHLVVLTQQVTKINQTISNEAADRKRHPTPPPPPR